MNLSALRPLTAGEIIDGGLALYRRHFARFFGLTLLLFWPSHAVALEDENLSLLFYFPFLALTTNAVVWQASELLLGRRPALGKTLRVAVRRWLPALIALIVFTLVLIVGFLLLIVPGIIFAVRLYPCAQVAVLERKISPLVRPWLLTVSSWTRILAVGVIRFFILLIPSVSLGLGTGRFSFLWGEPPESPPPLAICLEFFLAALLLPFYTLVDTLLYFDLRVRREAVDVLLAAQALESVLPAPRGPEVRPEV